MKLPRFTTKQLVWLLGIISLSAFFHVWYLNHILSFANNVGTLIAKAQRKYNNILYSDDAKYVLFWNGVTLSDQTVHCAAPGDNCVFKIKTNDSFDAQMYNAIVFNELVLASSDRPSDRSENQLFVFWSSKAPANAPACHVNNDNYFNWTMTYRLDSTIVWSNFIFRDIQSGNIVAPNKSVVWKTSKDPIRADLKNVLSKKKKILTWVMPHCKSNYKRDLYLNDLQDQMERQGLYLDVYGPCTKVRCTYDNCNEMLKRDYYFYIAFEDYFAEDFVTEKVMHAYRNLAVPIVYGGANYSRFLPPGSYLNAKDLHPYALTNLMKEAMNNATVYESYFTWKNNYNVSSYDSNHPLCTLCAALNADLKIRAPAIPNFRQWWNTPETNKACNAKLERSGK